MKLKIFTFLIGLAFFNSTIHSSNPAKDSSDSKEIALAAHAIVESASNNRLVNPYEVYCNELVAERIANILKGLSNADAQMVSFRISHRHPHFFDTLREFKNQKFASKIWTIIFTKLNICE